MTCNTAPYDRIFFELGPISIYWYGAIIALGAFIGLYLATRESDRLGINKDYIVDLVVIAIPVAIIFARIYYVIFEWTNNYAHGPFWKIFAVWEGGLAIHGALIGSVLTAIIYARVRKLSFWQLADIAAPSLILGQAVGRWGNFMNQEAFGGPIAVNTYERFHQYIPDFIMNQMCINGVYHHPTFLYESVWNLLVLALLLYLRKVNPYRGEIFLTYVMSYSVGRFFIEGLRTDSLYIIEGLRTAQFLSVILIIGAISLIIYRRRTGMVKNHYNGKKITR